MKRATIASLLFTSGIAAVALSPASCSTGVAEELFVESPGGESGSGNTGSSSATTGGPSGSGGTATVGSGGTGGSSAESSSGAGGDPSTSSSTAASSSSAGQGGSGGSAPTDTVACDDNTTCPVGGRDACCWNRFDKAGACVSGPPNNDMCDTSAQGHDTRIECQTEAQCATGLCCGDRVNSNQGPFYAEVVCQQACDDITLCDQEGEEGPDCPVVQTQNGPIQSVCKPSTLLPPGFLVCSTNP